MAENETIEISVVMPVYNMERFLAEAIESVLQQTYSNLELLLIDDCSRDASLSIARKYASEDARIRVIALPKNQGVAEARNRGILEARGDYIALLDSDDVWTKEKLHMQISRIRKSCAEIAYCSYDFIDERGQVIKKPFLVPAQTDFRHMLTSSVISCSTALIQADLLKKHLFSGEQYHEDYVLWMELLSIPGIRAVGCPEILTHYRQVSGSRSNDKGSSAKNRWKIYRECIGMNLISSAWAFLGYACNAMKKYYF